MSIQDIVDFSQANTTAERYRPDPAKVFKGDPEQTVFNHYSSPCGSNERGRMGRRRRPVDGQLHRA